jgi:hypothetical protein
MTVKPRQSTWKSVPFLSSSGQIYLYIRLKSGLFSFFGVIDFKDFCLVWNLWVFVKWLRLLELLSLLPIPFVNLVSIESQLLRNFLGFYLIPFRVTVKILLKYIDLLFIHQMIWVQDWLLVITFFWFMNYFINKVFYILRCLDLYWIFHDELINIGHNLVLFYMIGLLSSHVLIYITILFSFTA